MALVIGLIIAAGLGLIPANIAKKKGYSFGLWWFYGWMLFIVAIIHVALIEDKNAKPVAYVPVGGAYAPAQSGDTAARHATNYTRLFSLPEKLYQTSAPVCVAEGALLKDEQSGCVFSQLKLFSVTDKTIRAVKASVSLMDAFGKPMNISVEHQYLDLCVRRGDTFGAETTVMLPDAHARAFYAAVTAVMFDDGTLWESSDAAWEPLPAPVVLLGIVFLIVLTKVIIPNGRYNKAVALMEAGKYEEATAAFESMDGYKDSAEKIEECETAGLDEQYDEAVALMEEEKYGEAIELILNLGDYKETEALRVLLWDHITGRKQTIAASWNTVGLKSDGTVVSTGLNDDGQCDVSDWTDIVAIAADGYHTIGLKSDGTVVAVGDNEYGQCDVDGWTDIKLPE